jgi:hypothetical protein
MARAEDAANFADFLPADLAGARHHINGSVAIFGQGADVDVVVEAPYRPAQYLADLVDNGWVYDGEAYGDPEFLAVRRGPVNLILCTSTRYTSFMAALAACCVLSREGALIASDKPARVAIYEGMHKAVDETLLGSIV